MGSESKETCAWSTAVILARILKPSTTRAVKLMIMPCEIGLTSRSAVAVRLRQRQRLRFGCLRRHARSHKQHRCCCFHGEAPSHRKPLNDQTNAEPSASTKAGGTNASMLVDQMASM